MFCKNKFFIFDMENKKINLQKNLWFEKIFGNKQFIIIMFLLFLPSAFQQLITTSVSYVDTFFIASFAPSQINGEFVDSARVIAKTSIGIAMSIINLPIMVIFGVTSGIGVMTAQYYGAKDQNRLQQTIIYKMLIGFVLIFPFILLFMIIPEKLVAVSRNVFNPENNSYDFYINKIASIYLFWSGLSFIFVLLTYTYAYSCREVNQQKYALIAAIISVIVNVVLDPLLIIFETNLENAIINIALSTSVASIVEFCVMLLFIYLKKEHYLMIKDFKLDWLTFKITIKNSWQAILNDALYGLATLFLTICLLVYSTNYHDAFTTVSIIIQFAVIIFPGMGASSAVLIGNELGKNNIIQAKKNSYYLIIWGSLITFLFAVILFGLSWFINPLLSPPPKNLLLNSSFDNWQQNQIIAKQLEWIMMPVIFSQGMFSILYFSIKSGGSKFIFFTDGFVMIIWCFLFGGLIFSKVINEQNIHPSLLFFLIELNQIVKAMISLIFYKCTNWAKNVT